MDTIQEPLATVPKSCPICEAKGPFEHLRFGFTCGTCCCWFQLDDKGELYSWGWTQKSAAVIARLAEENLRLRRLVSAFNDETDE